jgi:hypothetical protein
VIKPPGENKRTRGDHCIITLELSKSNSKRVYSLIWTEMLASRQSNNQWGRTRNYALVTHDALRSAVQPPLRYIKLMENWYKNPFSKIKI